MDRTWVNRRIRIVRRRIKRPAIFPLVAFVIMEVNESYGGGEGGGGPIERIYLLNYAQLMINPYVNGKHERNC